MPISPHLGLSRDDKASLAGALVLLLLAIPTALIGQRVVALGEVAISAVIICSTAIELALRRSGRKVFDVRLDVAFRCAMSFLVGIAVLALGAFLVTHAPLPTGIAAMVATIALGSIFILGAWANWKASRAIGNAEPAQDR